MQFLASRAVAPLLLAAGLATLVVLLDPWFEGLAIVESWNVNAAAYDVFLEVVAGVGGVFLALYFTAISAVAAAVYTSVPHDIRSLIVRDRVGNLYVRSVALATALAVILLALRAATGDLYESALPLVATLSVFSVFAFITLGQRAFYLADPTQLAGTLVEDFTYWVEHATVGSGWRSNDAAFQRLYRANARTAIDSLRSLMDIASDQPHLRGESVRRLATTISGLVARYLVTRRKIPTSSRWFGQRPQHQQWYLSGSTELDLAIATDTALSATLVPDVEWVEEGLLRSLLTAVERDLKADSYEGAFSTLESFPDLWSRLGLAWEVPEGVRWATDTADVVLASVLDRDEGRRSLRPALLPGLCDVLASIPMALELGLHRAILAKRPHAYAQQLAAMDWTDAESPYSLPLPRTVIGDLENAQLGVRFEAQAAVPEGVRTPGWYVAELALRSYELEIQRQVLAAVAFCTTWYPRAADSLAKVGYHEAAAAIHTRGIETAWKLRAHIGEWEAVVNEIRDLPLNVDWKRPEWDWDGLRAQVEHLRSEVLVRMARSVPQLMQISGDPSVPDYLGQAVHRSGQACFDALERPDADLFKRVFPAYFFGALAVSDRLRPEVANWQLQPALNVMSEPVLEVLDLSGYALIFSELHGDDELWRICEKAWGDYLADDGGPRLEWIAAVHAYQRQQLGIHRSLRSQWQRRLEQRLEALPRKSRALERLDDEPEVDHASALIRRLAPDDDLGMLHVRGSDVLVARFLGRLDGASELDFGVPEWITRDIAHLEQDGGNH